MRLPHPVSATLALLGAAACSGNHDATVVTELRFGPPAVFPLGTPSAQGLAFTDLDGDGFLDAVSTDRAGGRLATLRASTARWRSLRHRQTGCTRICGQAWRMPSSTETST